MLSEVRFPDRGGVKVLRQHVQAYLEGSDLVPGEGFPTDAQVAEMSRLSLSTVRRALMPLHREGWVVREPGRGSFVGARVKTGLKRRTGR